MIWNNLSKLKTKTLNKTKKDKTLLDRIDFGSEKINDKHN